MPEDGEFLGLSVGSDRPRHSSSSSFRHPAVYFVLKRSRLYAGAVLAKQIENRPICLGARAVETDPVRQTAQQAPWTGPCFILRQPGVDHLLEHVVLLHLVFGTVPLVGADADELQKSTKGGAVASLGEKVEGWEPAEGPDPK